MVNVPVTTPKTSELRNAKNAKKSACDCGDHEVELREEDPLPETPNVGDADDIIADPTFADANTFTSIPSSTQTDKMTNIKDSSSESTREKDPQVEQVLLLSPRFSRKRPASQDNTNSNFDCQITGAFKTNINLTKRIWQKIHDKEKSDPNINCQITGSTNSYVPRPKQRRENLDSADFNLIPNEEMLNDAVINKAQMLLHEQFPGVAGLEDTTLGLIFSSSQSKKANLSRYCTMETFTGFVFQILVAKGTRQTTTTALEAAACHGTFRDRSRPSFMRRGPNW